MTSMTNCPECSHTREIGNACPECGFPFYAAPTPSAPTPENGSWPGSEARAKRDREDDTVALLRTELAGRRLLICREGDALHETVSKIPGNTAEEKRAVAEVLNLIVVAQRLAIALNDGGCSPHVVPRF